MSISSVTSEALQLKLRQLLPSQQGFGTDLSASDTIIPVIDLTSAAEGSDVGVGLQTALAFGSQTAFDVANTTTTIANSPGFYRIVGNAQVVNASGSVQTSTIILSDGVSDKIVYGITLNSAATQTTANQNYDLIVFLTVSEVCKISTDANSCRMMGSIRQIADSNGTLVQPVGFNPQ